MSNLGSYLGNLGDTLFELKRLDEAEIAFQQAIANCDDTFPAAAGAFRGSLALLMAQDGQLDEALVLLEKGEAQIVVFPEEHAKFLCKKGQAQLLAGQLPAARASLTQARTLTSGLHLGESREISSAIAQLESLLGGSSIEDPVSAHPSTEEGMLEILEGDRLVELGRIQYEESKFEEATGNFQAALDIYRAHQTRRGEGEALMELGKVCRQEGNPRKATYYFECALQIYRHIGDRQLEGVVLGDLGNVYQQQDQLDDAIEHYTLALEIHREMGARRFEGRVLGNLGSAYLAQGRFDEVIEHYQLALEINREFGNKRFEAAILGNLGSVYRVQGKLGEAITQYKLALPIYREIGDRRFEGVFLGNLGSAYRLQGELEEAVKHYTLALEIHREFGDERFEGAFLGNLGEALVELGRIDEARQAFEASISACDATGYLVGAGSFRGHLALLLARQGQSAKAWDLLDTGESYLVTHPHDHGRLLCTKGQVQLMDEQRDAARVSLASAQAIASQIGVGEHSELVMEIAKLEMLLDGDATEELATDPAY
jgi:tetratricopeptide (TPR) repeat protein